MKYNEQRFLLNFPWSTLVEKDDGSFEIRNKDNEIIISWSLWVEAEELWAKAFIKYQDAATRDLIISKCNCKCHKPGVTMLHCMPCCNARWENWKIVSIR